MERQDSLAGELLRGKSFLGEYNGRWLPQRKLMQRLASYSRDGAMLPAPEEATKDKYLVVFDLDETIVYARDGPLLMRPHAKELLVTLGEISEIALWTAGVRDYAKAVMIEIEKAVWGTSPAGVIKHCISRSKAWYDEEDYTKDLKLLGRDLDKVLIVENTPDCVRLNPKNAIIVEDYEGETDQGHVLALLRIVIEDLIASGKAVQEFIPTCRHLKRQVVEDVGPVYYLSATGSAAVKEVKTNRDKKQAPTSTLPQNRPVANITAKNAAPTPEGVRLDIDAECAMSVGDFSEDGAGFGSRTSTPPPGAAATGCIVDIKAPRKRERTDCDEAHSMGSPYSSDASSFESANKRARANTAGAMFSSIGRQATFDLGEVRLAPPTPKKEALPAPEGVEGAADAVLAPATTTVTTTTTTPRRGKSARSDLDEDDDDGDASGPPAKKTKATPKAGGKRAGAKAATAAAAAEASDEETQTPKDAAASKKPAAKKAAGKRGAKTKPPPSDSEDDGDMSCDADSEDIFEEVTKKAARKAGGKRGAAKATADDSDEETAATTPKKPAAKRGNRNDVNDADTAAVTKAAKKPARKVGGKKASAEVESASDEDAAPAKKPARKAGGKRGKAAAAADVSSESEDDAAAAPKKPTRKAGGKAASNKRNAASAAEDDTDSGDAAPAKKAARKAAPKKATPKKAREVAADDARAAKDAATPASAAKKPAAKRGGRAAAAK